MFYTGLYSLTGCSFCHTVHILTNCPQTKVNVPQSCLNLRSRNLNARKEKPSECSEGSMSHITILILLPPSLHSIQYRTECFSQLTERILYSRRNLCINRSDNDTVTLHRTQALSQHLLTDAFKRLLQFVKSPRTDEKIPQDQQLPFVSDKLYRCRNRTIGQFLFFQHSVPPIVSKRMLYSL